MPLMMRAALWCSVPLLATGLCRRGWRAKAGGNGVDGMNDTAAY